MMGIKLIFLYFLLSDVIFIYIFLFSWMCNKKFPGKNYKNENRTKIGSDILIEYI
jgi:hypothetical protein